MNYCQVEDVRIALVQSAADEGTNTAADMDDLTIDDAIAEASAQVDVYIGGPYQPTETIPDPIKYLTRDVAAFLATCTWRKSKDFTPQDPVLLRYNWAIAQLNSINTGASIISGMPAGGADDVATVINNYQFTLFHPWQFDLTGRGRGVYPFGPPVPVGRGGGWIFWGSD